MQAADYDKAGDLLHKLQQAKRTLQVFEGITGPNVPVFAKAESAYGPNASVELLPVTKEQAVSAAQRAVAKLEGELAQLGVQV